MSAPTPPQPSPPVPPAPGRPAVSLTRTTLVWRQGMANWVAAETVPELQPLFAAAPPPLPK